jgi:hypothetical protein
MNCPIVIPSGLKHECHSMNRVVFARCVAVLVDAFLKGSAPAQKHLNTMDLLNGNLDCRPCKMPTQTV